MSNLVNKYLESMPKIKRAVPKKSEYREKFKNKTLTLADLAKRLPKRTYKPLTDYSDPSLTEGEGLEYG